MDFTKLYVPRKSFSQKRFKKHQTRAKKILYHPLHEAAESGNSAVLGAILKEASFSLPNKLLFETFDSRGQSVVELMVRKFDSFADRLDSAFVRRVEEKFGFTLLDGIAYDESLLHYLLATGGQHVGLVRHLTQPSKDRHYSRTPQDKW